MGVVAVLALGAAGTVGVLRYQAFRNPVEQARTQLGEGNPATAQFLLHGASRAQPDNGEIQLLLGRAYLQLDNMEAAERALRRAAALGIGPDRLRLPLLAALVGQRKSREVLALVDEAGTAGPDGARVLISRAAALEQLGDLASARATLDEAGRADAKLIDVPLTLAGLALRYRQPTEAEQQIARALRLDGRSTDALVLKAQLQEQVGQRPAAIDTLARLVATDPKANGARLERARMLIAASRTAEARADVAALLAREPKNVMANYLSATLLEGDGRHADADAILQKLSRFMGRLPRGWYTVAVVKLQLEQLEQAAEAAEKYVARAPRDGEGRKLMARIALAAKRPGQAVATLEPAVAAGVADAGMLELLGAAQAMAGRLADAELTLLRASTAAPDSAEVQARLGAVRLMAGNAEGAADALTRSLDLRPGQPETGELLVVASLAAGDPDRAQQALSGLRRRTGGDPAVTRLEALLDIARLDLPAASERLAGSADGGTDPALRLNLAQILLMQNRTNEAVAMLEASLAGDPANRAALDVLVPVLEQSGQVARAAALLDAAQAAAPADPGFTILQSRLLVRAKDLAHAVGVFDAASVADRSDPRLLLARADAEAAAGQGAAARATLEGLTDRFPARVDIAVRLADVLTGEKAYPAAIARLQAALAVVPHHPELLRALVWQRFQEGGLDAALREADTLRTDPANGPAALLLRGDVLSAAGRHAEAAAAYGAELAATPSEVLAVRTAAELNASQGPVTAAQLLRRWVDAHPDDGAAARLLASMLTATKRFEAARDVLKAVLAHNPGDSATMNNLAWVYHELGDARAYPLALRAYLVTFSPNAADTLGCILLAQQRGPEALVLLRYAARAMPDNLPVQFHLAQAMRQAGQMPETRTLLAQLSGRNFEGHALARKLLDDHDAR